MIVVGGVMVNNTGCKSVNPQIPNVTIPADVDLGQVNKHHIKHY